MIISLTITAESAGESILQVGQYLAQLWAIVQYHVFRLTGRYHKMDKTKKKH